ncbi:MAG: glycosyltransferase [Bacteroidota bacterium]|nr:glycosyltransferase [Bacteroidota bacterium]
MLDKKTKVTIGLPTYNSQKYLEYAINSILAQTYKDLILIINDDGSTDKTDEICRTFAAQDKRIRYSRSERNLGGAINYQRVFQLADTEYFRWAAHDDALAPQLIERCIEVLDREPDVVMCYPRALNIDENGNILGEYDDNFDLRSVHPNDRFKRVLKGMYGHAGNPMFGVVRRELMAKTALIAPFPASDMTFVAELSLYGKFFEISERLYYHRIHSGMSNKLGLTTSEYTAWHDKSKAGKLSFPKILRLKALIAGVKKSPIVKSERIKCYFHIFSYYVSLKNIPKLWRQINYYVSIRLRRMQNKFR